MSKIRIEYAKIDLEVDRYLTALRSLLEKKRQRLPKQTRYGKVELLGWAERRVKGRTLHRCQCLCGHSGFFTSHRLHLSRMLDEGCAQDGCFATSQVGKYWLNSEYSLRRQWAHYLFSNPFEVDPAWGGQMYPGVALVDEAEAFKAFWKHVKPQLCPRRGKLWLRKQVEGAPLMEGNISISVRPPVNLPVWGFINFGGSFVDYGSIASLIRVKKELLHAVHLSSTFSADALELLSADNNEGNNASVQILSDEREVSVESDS